MREAMDAATHRHLATIPPVVAAGSQLATATVLLAPPASSRAC